jgi:hypothetical protein
MTWVVLGVTLAATALALAWLRSGMNDLDRRG